MDVTEYVVRTSESEGELMRRLQGYAGEARAFLATPAMVDLPELAEQYRADLRELERELERVCR